MKNVAGKRYQNSIQKVTLPQHYILGLVACDTKKRAVITSQLLRPIKCIRIKTAETSKTR